jgi:hypothetical protein
MARITDCLWPCRRDGLKLFRAHATLMPSAIDRATRRAKSVSPRQEIDYGTQFCEKQKVKHYHGAER